MNKSGLITTSSPHLRDADSVAKIMHTVNLSLLPAAVAAVYFFGLSAFLVMLTCVTFSVATEWTWEILRGKKITVTDGSAILTGLLLAFTLPPRLPLWMAALGAVVAVSLGKQIYGGLGMNPFNPALVGRAFLLAAFGSPMTTWFLPGAGIDAKSSATPLALMKLQHQPSNYWDLFIGNTGGSLGETCAIAIILGGAFLVLKGIVDYRIPVGYFGTVMLMTAIFGQDPVFHLFAGGLMLGGFYMLTDMVTSPITRKGRWIFGIGAGILLVIIRLWSNLPEGVMYSILLMNMATPLLNRFTRPRAYGEV